MKVLKFFLLGITVLIWLVLPIKAFSFYSEDFNSGLSNPEDWNVLNRGGNISFSSSHILLSNNFLMSNSFPYVYNIVGTVPSSGPYDMEVKFNYLSVGNFGNGIAFSPKMPPADQYLDPNHRDYILFLVWQDPRGLQIYTTLCSEINIGCSRNLTLLWNSGTVDLSNHVLRASYRENGQYLLYFDNLDVPIFTSELGQPRATGLWMGSPERTMTFDYWSSFQVDYYRAGSLSVTPTPTPTPTSQGSFDLPFSYPNRPNSSASEFRNAFWNRLTAAFDHVFEPGTFRPFTGNTYSTSDCPHGIFNIDCYDSHNGTDFSKNPGQEVYSVAHGEVVYVSEHTTNSCTPNKGGYGCVVIVTYPNGTYGLYAHLDKIYVNAGNTVETTTLLGEMGETGCPGCGEHLHFGVLRAVDGSTSSAKKMSKLDWKEMIYQMKPKGGNVYRPACTYKAPNGAKFYFQDPSGWRGNDTDPWSISRDLGGCGVISPYLWKFDVGTSL